MTKPKKRKLYIVRKTLATILLSVLVVALVVSGFALNMLRGMIEEKPELDVERLKTPESTLVYDAEGKLFAEIGLKLSDNVKYDEIPNIVIDAFISIEDSKFFDHEGFDLARFTNESIQTAIRFLRGGGFGAGASTITMQIIKNSIFSDDESLAEESIDRKAQEISLAMDLEKITTKQEILEFYLNKINFGVPKSRGIAKAAIYYFNKSVSELNLSEAAYLAGVINEPANLNAYTNIEAATARRNVVLDMMLRHGYISPQEHTLATAVKLENQLWGEDKYYGDVQPYQEYLDAVIDEITEVYGIDPYNQGLKIYTALNRSQQDLIEAIENNEYGRFYDDVIDGAFVTLNNQNFEIVALGGGRKFEGQETVQRGFNNSLSLTRQPGSVLKPILPYALSYDYLGYSNKHVIEDGPYVYAGSPIFVYNYSRTFIGDITIQDAVINSLNIPALKTLDRVLSNEGIGYERTAEFLKAIGLDPAVAENVSSAYAIGGGTLTATPLQIAAAHATMMNDGQYIKPHTIRKIEFPDKDPIEANFQPVQTVSAEAAYIVAQTMKAAVDSPTGTAAVHSKKPYPVYGKTGTSDHDDTYDFGTYGIPEGSTKDGWHAMSTSEYTHVGWTGYKEFVTEDGQYHYIQDTNFNSRQLAELVNIMLDNAANFHTPVAIERPAGVVNIQHVLGVYPYAAPVAGMDPAYITDALIIDKFSRLTRLEAANLDSLSEQKVTVGEFASDGLKLNVTMTKYPIKDSVDLVNRTKVMSATNSLGETRSYTGRVLFHPSWMFGSVNYGTEIKLNGNVIESVFNTSESRDIVLTNVESNQNIQVCSFYTFDRKTDTRSNEICNTVNTGNQKLKMPQFVGKPIAEAQEWITANTSAGITLKQVAPQSRDQLGLIASITPNYADQEVTKDVLDRANFTINYYDGEVTNLQSYVGRQVRSLQNDLGQLFTLNGPLNDLNARITSVTVNGQAVNSFAISSTTTITFTVKEVAPEPAPNPEPTPEPTPEPDPNPQP